MAACTWERRRSAASKRESTGLRLSSSFRSASSGDLPLSFAAWAESERYTFTRGPASSATRETKAGCWTLSRSLPSRLEWAQPARPRVRTEATASRRVTGVLSPGLDYEEGLVVGGEWKSGVDLGARVSQRLEVLADGRVALEDRGEVRGR